MDTSPWCDMITWKQFSPKTTTGSFQILQIWQCVIKYWHLDTKERGTLNFTLKCKSNEKILEITCTREKLCARISKQGTRKKPPPSLSTPLWIVAHLVICVQRPLVSWVWVPQENLFTSIDIIHNINTYPHINCLKNVYYHRENRLGE